jgi:DMSO/TMAO reductase YedYZ molybdopterin-dependent catalytic subunit
VSASSGDPRPWAGRLAGLAVGVAGIGAGQLASSFGSPGASPVVAIGQAAIDLSPEPLRAWAIRTFGTADKTVLVAGIAVILLGLSGLLGPLALRRRPIGLAAIAACAAVGAAAALTRPHASPAWAVPSALAGVAAAAGFAWLARRAGQGTERGARTEAGPGAPAGRPFAFDRRRFLRAALAVGAAGAGASVLGASRGRTRAAVARARASVRLPRPWDPAPPVPAGADLHVAGLSPFLTPNASFYRVDTALFVPEVDARSWTLRIRGSVEREASYTFDELLDRPLIERDLTLACVSNEVGGRYVGNARWLGVPLAPLLRESGVRPEADQLVSRSVDGFTAGTPMRLVLDGRDAMLALGMNGDPLPLEHGFPVRMVVPGLYGYESATKWLAELEATTYAAYDPYWVQRGWARIAPIKTQSRIDTPRAGSRLPAGRVIVAGVGWAQHTGVESVEVRVDDGPWSRAELAAQDSIDTWRQWRWDWDATPGTHSLAVRATDRDGLTQPGTPVPAFPAGAEGWHTVNVTVA